MIETKQIEVMHVIGCFAVDNPHCKSPWTKQFFSLVCFVSIDQIHKTKICHMVASENPEVIEGR